MAITNLVDVVNNIKKNWAPIVEKELYEKTVLASLLRAPAASLSVQNFREGDTVRVSEYDEGVGQLLTIDQVGGGCAFTTEKVTATGVDVKIDKRAVYATEFCDLVDLQSQVHPNNAGLRGVARRAIERQINTHLYSLIAPSVAHTQIKATLNASELNALAGIADAAFWPEGERWLVVDSKYWQDLLNDSTLTSSDFGAVDSPVISGMMPLKRYGWNIVKDISAPLKAVIGGGTAGAAVAFIPTFMPLVVQQGLRPMASNGHSNQKFTLNFSIDTVFGASLGPSGADKHMKITAV